MYTSIDPRPLGSGALIRWDLTEKLNSGHIAVGIRRFSNRNGDIGFGYRIEFESSVLGL